MHVTRISHVSLTIPNSPKKSVTFPPHCGPNKYGVGLVKPTEPVKVKPKNDFCSNLPQYPLKPEVVKGQKLFFNSLLKASVIPCPDSVSLCVHQCFLSKTGGLFKI